MCAVLSLEVAWIIVAVTGDVKPGHILRYRIKIYKRGARENRSESDILKT